MILPPCSSDSLSLPKRIFRRSIPFKIERRCLNVKMNYIKLCYFSRLVNRTWHHGDGVAAILSSEGARRTHSVVSLGEERITEHDGVPEDVQD